MPKHEDPRTGKVTCSHDNVATGPRPDRETCLDCGSSWPPGSVTGPREEDQRIAELTAQRLAEIERAQTAGREAEVNRRVEVELANRAAAAKSQAKEKKSADS